MSGLKAVPHRARSSSIRELLLAALALSLLALVAFGSHIADGGFYSDDWSNAADLHFAEPPRVWSAIENFQGELGARFLLGPAVVLPHEVFGREPGRHLALAAALAVLAALSFFLLLRTLGFEEPHAVALAVLALVFPWADSTRLWSVAGINNIAVVLYFLSVTVALHALRFSGRRGLIIHGVGQVLFLFSVFMYEVSLFAIFLSLLFYLHVAPSRRLAITRWRADLVIGVLALVAVAILTSREAPTVHELAAAAVLFPLQGTALLGHTLLPVGLPDFVAAAAAVGVAGLIAAGALRGTTRPIDDSEIRRWLYTAVTAVAFIGAAHLVFFGSQLPLREGTENRGNILAAFGYVVLAYSLIAATVRIWAVRTGRRAGAVSWAPVAIACAMAAGYVVHVRDDALSWDEAADHQTRILAAIDEAAPAVQPASTIYVMGAPLRVSPGIPIFAEDWDLSAALELQYEDHSLDAYPIDPETRFVCGRRGMHPSRDGYFYGPSAGYGPREGAPYGRAVVIDVRTPRAAVISNADECREAATRLRGLS